MNYFAFLPALANQGTNPDYYDKTGFFSNPPGPYGQQYASLGGQGISVSSYIDDARKAAALEFNKWFAQDDTQMKGFTYARSPGMPAVHAGFALILLGAALLVFPAGVARSAPVGEGTAGWVYVTHGRDLLLAEWARRGQNPPREES